MNSALSSSASSALQPTTANGALSNSTEGFPAILLLSCKVSEHMCKERLHTLLRNAWNECPLKTLQVIAHIGNSRGACKGKRENMNAILPRGLWPCEEEESHDGGMLYKKTYMMSLQWMFDNHPSTLTDNTNLALLARNGCLRDLLDLCIYAVHGDMENKDSTAYEGSVSWYLGVSDRVVPDSVRRKNFWKSVSDFLRMKGLPCDDEAVRSCITFSRDDMGSQKMPDTEERKSNRWLRRLKANCKRLGIDADLVIQFSEIEEGRETYFSQGDYGCDDDDDDDSKEYKEGFSRRNPLRKTVEAKPNCEKKRDMKANYYNPDYEPSPCPVVWTNRWIKFDRSHPLYSEFSAWKVEQNSNLAKVKAAEARHAKRDAMENMVVAKRKECEAVDKLYRQTAVIFTALVGKDSQDAEAGRNVGGLGSKWAPTPGGRHSRLTCLDKDIAALLKVDVRQYRSVLSRNRGAAHIPEHYMGAKDALPKIDFSSIPSKALVKYDTVIRKELAKEQELFWAEKKRRAQEFKAKLSAAKDAGLTISPEEAQKLIDSAKLCNSNAALPHVMVKTVMSLLHSHLFDEKYPAQLEYPHVLDLQYETMVLQTKIKVDSKPWVDVPLCDVSGSMGQDEGVPMYNSIALGLLMAESQRSGSALFGKVITFESDPHLVDLSKVFEAYPIGSKGSLGARVWAMAKMEWGGSTNMEAAFKYAIDLCIASEVDLKRLRVVVFSDMQFDQSFGFSFKRDQGVFEMKWQTNYNAITSYCREKGFKGFVPNLVFWNLASGVTEEMPVPARAGNVSQVTGSGPAILHMVMNGEPIPKDPLASLRGVFHNPAHRGYSVLG